MPRMSMVEAIRDAMDCKMAEDERVVVFGEDVGYFGGVFRCTDGLQRKYGKRRKDLFGQHRRMKVPNLAAQLRLRRCFLRIHRSSRYRCESPCLHPPLRGIIRLFP